MSIGADYPREKTAEAVISLEHFMKRAPRELGLNSAALVILATLALPGVAYLSATEIIEKTAGNRCWVYHSLRMLLAKGLVDSLKQHRTSRNQVRTLYSINGKGIFYLTQALRPDGITKIKAFEGAR